MSYNLIWQIPNNWKIRSILIFIKIMIIFLSIQLISCKNNFRENYPDSTKSNFTNIDINEWKCIINNSKQLNKPVAVDVMIGREGSIGVLNNSSSDDELFFQMIFSDLSISQLLYKFNAKNRSNLAKVSKPATFDFIGFRTRNGACGISSPYNEILFVEKIISFD